MPLKDYYPIVTPVLTFVLGFYSNSLLKKREYNSKKKKFQKKINELGNILGKISSCFNPVRKLVSDGFITYQWEDNVHMQIGQLQLEVEKLCGYIDSYTHDWAENLKEISDLITAVAYHYFQANLSALRGAVHAMLPPPFVGQTVSMAKAEDFLEKLRHSYWTFKQSFSNF